MNQSIKRASAIMLAVVLMVTGAFALSNVTMGTDVNAGTDNTYRGKTPKYVFLFIGDGMSYAQISAATDYLGVQAYEGKEVKDVDLSFTEFETVGTVTTFDSTSFCPDSASTATSIATGYKTHSGTLSMDESKTVAYETIAEKLKEQKGYKIGIVSSVGITHATPAAFYSHQPSRNNYTEIGRELINSGFDYFGGGGFYKDKEGVLLAEVEAAGFTVPKTNEEILALNPGDIPVFAPSPEFDHYAMPYELDRKNGDLSLADFTRKGIDVLFNNNDKGFFMMVEAGKIDWAGHANDAAANITDTIALSKAVDEAIEFYNKYPDDTLILVTGDHETGGMTIGYAATGYSTYLDIIENQEMSYDVFDDKVDDYRAANTPFAKVMTDITANFSLSKTAADEKLVLTDYEYQKLEDAYAMSMVEKNNRDYTDQERLLYGGYDPLTVTLTHVLNNKAGIGWTSYSHTGVPVGMFAKGVGEETFKGYYDNTDIFVKLAEITDVK